MPFIQELESSGSRPRDDKPVRSGLSDTQIPETDSVLVGPDHPETVKPVPPSVHIPQGLTGQRPGFDPLAVKALVASSLSYVHLNRTIGCC